MGNAAVKKNSIKFLDLVQSDPQQFNNKQEVNKKTFIDENGEPAYKKIRFGGRHHPLNAIKSRDYRLSEEEMKKLLENGYLFKNSIDKTFMDIYHSLYNNDMPVVITTDAMLYALHKFYDNFIKQIEVNGLRDKLYKLCEIISKTIENTNNLSAQYELLFVVPLVIINMTRKLDAKFEKLNYECKPYINKKEFVMPKEHYPSQETIRLELSQGFKCESISLNNQEKFKMFCDYYNIDDQYIIGRYIHNSPKYQTYWLNFECPDVKIKPNLKYATYDQLDDIIRNILANKDIEFEFGNAKINFIGTMFKPRGHYTQSFELEKYFMVFMWLSMCNINLDTNYHFDEYVATASIITKLLSVALPEVNEFLNFIEKIIGKPSNYSVPTFLPIINKYVPEYKNIDDTVGWIKENSKTLSEKVRNELEYTKMSIISRGVSIDNYVISEMVDERFIEDNGNIPKRKFPSILDLVYTLFDNKSVYPMIQQTSQYKYHNHLDKIAKQCDDYKFGNSLYDHELKLLRSLTADKSEMEKLGYWPFNTEIYKKKSANTQISHYSELVHDNMLYNEECVGGHFSCEYPDLLVEPAPTFWKEYLVMVQKLKELTEIFDRKILGVERCLYKIYYFERVVTSIIEYLDCKLNNKTPSKELVEYMKSIITKHYGSGGDAYYEGWYYNLFYEEDAFTFKPEVSSIFTGVNDERGPGGIVHIGTGPTKLLYLLSKDPYTHEVSIFMGPAYSCYETITDYQTRYNDEDWMVQHNNYMSFDFNHLV